MEFFEKFLNLYGPLGGGWILSIFLIWVLYKHAGQYIRVLTQASDGASGVAATLESLEASLSAAISRHSERLDRIEGLSTTHASEMGYVRADTSESVGLLRRVTRKKQ